MNQSSHQSSHSVLREEVHFLAEEAFHQHLISGYGDGEHPEEYQIVYQGKPRHLPLERARSFLVNLLQSKGNGLAQFSVRLRLGLSLLLEEYRKRVRDQKSP
jgi:hypothetical protein